MSLRDYVCGVDFSGARDAGRHIWISEGLLTPNGVTILKLFRLDSLTGGIVELQPTLDTLVDYIGQKFESIIGFDFPFGIPNALFQEKSWLAFVDAFPHRYPTAEKFLAICRTLANGKELKRTTDIEAKAPWCTYNVRLFRQTWAGLHCVISPLVLQGKARAIPMQLPERGTPIIAEVCPASFLKREQMYGPYKGRGNFLKAARSDILDKLIQLQMLTPVTDTVRRTIIKDAKGDALDAVLAALATARIKTPNPINPIDILEARIYF